MVLDDFVFKDTHPRLFDSHLRQGNAHVVGRQRRNLEDVVHLLLRVVGENGLGFLHLGHQRIQLRAFDRFLLGILLFVFHLFFCCLCHVLPRKEK